MSTSCIVLYGTYVDVHLYRERFNFVANQYMLHLYLDLAGPGLMEQHCTVEHVDGVVMLYPKEGECYINYEEVTQPTKLNQGKKEASLNTLLSIDFGL